MLTVDFRTREYGNCEDRVESKDGILRQFTVGHPFALISTLNNLLQKKKHHVFYYCGQKNLDMLIFSVVCENNK